MKAGLFDRAEEAYQALAGTSFDTEARLALLDLHERSRDWRAAVEVAEQLEKSGSGSFASRIAHYRCELALEADAARPARRRRRRARARARRRADRRAAARARRRARRGARRPRRGAALVEHADVGAAGGVQPRRQALRDERAARPATAAARWRGCRRSTTRRRRSTCCRRSRCSSPTTARAASGCSPICASTRPSAAAQALLGASTRGARRAAAAPSRRRRTAAGLGATEAGAVRDAVRRAARPLHRYRCAACGFEAEHYFWQCPGCLGWDTYPPQRLEDLVKPAVPTRDQLARGARPRRRRRDARPLLVRRGRAHLARGAGADRSRQPEQGAGAARRRGQRRLERQGARRARQPADGDRRRRARPPAREAAREERHRDALQARSAADDDRQAARHRPLAAAAARRLRGGARPRSARRDAAAVRARPDRSRTSSCSPTTARAASPTSRR